MRSICPNLRTISVVAAMARAAGMAPPALAAPPAQPKLGLSAARSGVTLRLNGMEVRTTDARILNQRVLTFSGSTKVLVLWQERSGASTTSWSALSLTGDRIDQ